MTFPPSPQEIDSWNAEVQEADSGGSQTNAPLYYSFAFAFDDAGLEDGLTVFTPSVGNGTVFLLDAAVIVDEGFDGTTPKLDIGTGVGSSNGLYHRFYGVVEADRGDSEQNGAGIQLATAGAPLQLSASAAADEGRSGFLPFTALNPLKLWVSQDGTIGGTAVGGTAGAGRLVFAIVTPTEVP